MLRLFNGSVKNACSIEKFMLDVFWGFCDVND